MSSSQAKLANSWRFFSSARLISAIFLQLEKFTSARKAKNRHFLPLSYFSYFPCFFRQETWHPKLFVFVGNNIFLSWLFGSEVQKPSKQKHFLAKSYTRIDSSLSARNWDAPARLGPEPFKDWLNLGNSSSNSSLLFTNFPAYSLFYPVRECSLCITFYWFLPMRHLLLKLAIET